MLSVQIFGTKKCQDSRKAERYFKERGIPFHYVDLTVRGLSKGELAKVEAVVGLENLINKDGKEYEKRNLKYLVHDVEEMLLAYPLLLRTPIVRYGAKAAIGFQPDIWEQWHLNNK